MYTSLRNIFEDCSHASKDFPILSIEFKEEEVKGFYRIYIQFQDLECYVISCQESGLEAAEKQICAEYQAEVDLQMKATDIRTAVKIVMDKAQRCRKEIN